MSNKTKHIHKYKRILIGGTKITKDPITGSKRLVKTDSATPYYKCILSGCNHKVLLDEMEGREFICWNCGGVGTFNSSMRMLLKPRHFQCRKKRKIEDEEEIFDDKLGMSL